MLTRRIIPCLDVKDGQVVKGVHFQNLAVAGDPVELATRYSDLGADELVFLDISATTEQRRHVIDLAQAVSRQVFIPFTIGGGLRTVEDIRSVLQAGADKVAINSAALSDPDILTAAADRYGSQCIVVAMDVQRSDGKHMVYSHGGTKPTGREALRWAREVEERGAGEILLTSIDSDGTGSGVDLEITRSVSAAVSIPVIASGGVGTLAHFSDALTIGRADAVLAASVFHREVFTIEQVKNYLKAAGLPVRMMEE